MHPANEAEVNKLEPVLQAYMDSTQQTPLALLADKGYASENNRNWLKEQGIVELIQHKGSRGRQVHPLHKQLNKSIGQLRFKVEQAFGTMKRQLHLRWARYFGTAKVQAQMCWAALGMNLLKAHNKLKALERGLGTSTP